MPACYYTVDFTVSTLLLLALCSPNYLLKDLDSREKKGECQVSSSLSTLIPLQLHHKWVTFQNSQFEFSVLTRQTTKNRVVKPYHFEQSYQKCLVALTQDGMNEKGRRGINHDKLPTLELGN